MFNSLDIYYLLCAKLCASPNWAFIDEYGPALSLRGTECKCHAGEVGLAVREPLVVKFYTP